jgi:acetyl esterase/lipase
MFSRAFLILISSLILISTFSSAQEQIVYKEINTTKLLMDVYYPKNIDSSKVYPAMVFFFGGGWVSGDVSQFINQANYFSKRGMVCFLVDYRTKSKNNTTPFECVKDAKSAIRFIRKRASYFRVDTTKIIASGGSAGGHLAAATALIESFSEATDDLSISCIPNALVLFNPVIDNGPGGYGFEKIKDAYKHFSPLHNIKKGAPPTIIFIGTNDKHIPIETVAYYKKVMEKVGSRCELKIYDGQNHGFFNYKNIAYYKKTVMDADAFLVSLGYLKNEPNVTIE